MIDPDTKTYLIAQVMKSEGWSAEKSEEWLADTFANFFLTGKIDGAPKSTWGRIKVFFKKVRAFINGLGKWRTELNDIFTNIITADNITDLQSKIDKNEQLNQAKEQMKKRFLGYAKNAQKIEKKMSGENKYQSAGENKKNVPRPLTDLESVRTRDTSLPNSITINDKNTRVILDNLDELLHRTKDYSPDAEEVYGIY